MQAQRQLAVGAAAPRRRSPVCNQPQRALVAPPAYVAVGYGHGPATANRGLRLGQGSVGVRSPLTCLAALHAAAGEDAGTEKPQKPHQQPPGFSSSSSSSSGDEDEDAGDRANAAISATDIGGSSGATDDWSDRAAAMATPCGAQAPNPQPRPPPATPHPPLVAGDAAAGSEPPSPERREATGTGGAAVTAGTAAEHVGGAGWAVEEGLREAGHGQAGLHAAHAAEGVAERVAYAAANALEAAEGGLLGGASKAVSAVGGAAAAAVHGIEGAAHWAADRVTHTGHGAGPGVAAAKHPDELQREVVGQYISAAERARAAAGVRGGAAHEEVEAGRVAEALREAAEEVLRQVAGAEERRATRLPPPPSSPPPHRSSDDEGGQMRA